MITTPSDYLSFLHLIQNQNKQTTAILLPKDETIYEVDLNARTIQAPEFLSVEKDHNAETIYFLVDRYFENIDLGREDIYVIVQYENANPDKKSKGYIYVPPFKDITTYPGDKENSPKMLFPWVIEGPATAYAGDVNFAVKFYKMSSDGQYDFNLNTQAAKSIVLHGMDVQDPDNNNNFVFDDYIIQQIWDAIDIIRNTEGIYWIKV